jgi:uncharacterized protein YkwD
MDCRRTLALLATFVLVGGCAPSSAFWDRSPKVAGVRRAQPPAPRPRPRAPEAAPYTAPAPSAPYGSGTAPRAQERFAPSGPTAEDVQVLERVNQIRRARGLHDFAWQSQLWRAAYDHSTEQQVHGYMGHGSPDPRRERLSQRFRQAGYEGNYYGEVVAWNYRTVEGVVRGWMNSPSHRAILLDCKMTEAAFARVGSYWTGNFGLPRARAATRRGGSNRAARGATAPCPRGSGSTSRRARPRARRRGRPCRRPRIRRRRIRRRRTRRSRTPRRRPRPRPCTRGPRWPGRPGRRRPPPRPPST